jgi:hypothetical protein
MTRKIVKALFLCLILGAVSGGLVACSPASRCCEDTYRTKSGQLIYLEDDMQSCERSCNAAYDRCAESMAARSPVGNGQMTGILGGEADCRDSLRSCLKDCRAP